MMAFPPSSLFRPIFSACVAYFSSRFCVDMGFRLPDLRKMLENLDINVFILSYRGYGESEGAPDEEGLMIDAEVRISSILFCFQL